MLRRDSTFIYETHAKGKISVDQVVKGKWTEKDGRINMSGESAATKDHPGGIVVFEYKVTDAGLYAEKGGFQIWFRREGTGPPKLGKP